MRNLNNTWVVMFHDPVSNLVKLGKLPSQHLISSTLDLVGCRHLNRVYRVPVGDFAPGTEIIDYQLLLLDGLVSGILLDVSYKGMKCMKYFLGAKNCRSVYNISHSNCESLSLHYINSPGDFLLQAGIEIEYIFRHDIDYEDLTMIAGEYVWRGIDSNGIAAVDSIILIDMGFDAWPKLNFELETRNLPEPILKP